MLSSAVQAGARGCLVGAGVEGARVVVLATAGEAIKVASGRQSLIGAIRRLMAIVRSRLEGIARAGLAVGAARSLFVLVQGLLEARLQRGGRQRSLRYKALPSFVAGAVASLGVLIDGGPGAWDRRLTIVIYVASRALESAVTEAVRTGLLPRLPFGSLAVFVVLCGLLMYAFVFEPGSLPPTYRKFCERYG